MLLPRGCDSLLVLHGERFKLRLSGGFALRLTLRVPLVLVELVVGLTALAVTGLAVGLRPEAAWRSTAKPSFSVIVLRLGQALG